MHTPATNRPDRPAPLLAGERRRIAEGRAAVADALGLPAPAPLGSLAAR